MKKNVAYLVIMLLVVTLLVACGTNNNAVNAPATDVKTPAKATEKDVNLTFSIWGNDSHKQMYEDMIVKFNEENPHIKVEIMTIPFADYQQKITIMQASRMHRMWSG